MTGLVTIDLAEVGQDRPDRAANNPYMAPKTADPGLSMHVMRKTRPIPRQCWRNAFVAYPTAVIAAEPSAVFYVEGQMLMPLSDGGAIPIEHGWLETEDGRVIETTIREAAQGEAGWTYYTGLRLPMTEVLEWLSQNRNEMPLMPLVPRRPEFDQLKQGVVMAIAAANFEAMGVALTIAEPRVNRPQE